MRFSQDTLVLFSLAWLVFLMLCVLILAISGNFYIAWLPLIVLYQGGHELQHCTLFKNKKSLANRFLGSICYSLFLHNFEFTKQSHTSHHKIGRMDLPNAMVDHPSGRFPRISYYLGLAGLNYWLYILAAPMWVLSKKATEIAFGKLAVRVNWVFVGLAFTALWLTLLLISNSATSIAATYIIFSMYWGLIQNSAHYGLEFGRGRNYKYVARTYNVPSWLHFVGFGTPFSHFEHHVLPDIPGVLLNKPDLKEKAIKKSGINPYDKYNLLDYVYHLFIAQWITPYPKKDGLWRLEAT